jgi:hypothetical protein
MHYGQTFFWTLMVVGLAAYFLDHLGRLNALEKNKMSAEERARSYRTPTNYEPFTALFDAAGKMSELVYAPIGMGLNAFGTVLEFVLKPIGMGLDAIGKISEFLWNAVSMPLGMVGAIGKKF